MLSGPFERRFVYFCLSTDTKPTLNVEGGSILYETNTGDKFIFSGNEWIQIISDVVIAT